jgi:hypothetical protein
MKRSNIDKTQDPKEALLELLKKKPPIYSDAVKYTLAVHKGIMFSSLFDDCDPKEDRETMLKELQKVGSWSVVNDPKGSSDVLLKLTEKGRDEIIDLFYDGKEKRELKRLIKKAELELRKGENYTSTKTSIGTPKKRTGP